MKRCPVLPDIEASESLEQLQCRDDDFDKASPDREKDFIQERQSVSLLEGILAPSEEEWCYDGCSWSDHFPGIVCICWSISGSA